MKCLTATMHPPKHCIKGIYLQHAAKNPNQQPHLSALLAKMAFEQVLSKHGLPHCKSQAPHRQQPDLLPHVDARARGVPRIWPDLHGDLAVNGGRIQLLAGLHNGHLRQRMSHQSKDIVNLKRNSGKHGLPEGVWRVICYAWRGEHHCVWHGDLTLFGDTGVAQASCMDTI